MSVTHDRLEKPKAYLFDFDGIIVDSEPLAKEALLSLAQSRDLILPADIIKHLTGLSYIDFFQFLRTKIPQQFSSHLFQEYLSILENLLEKKSAILPGVMDFLKRHKYKYHYGLVSGSGRHQIDIVLSKFGLNNVFDVIISRDDVQEGKPSPESYLLAKERLNVAQEACLVFEDASLGVESARKALMFSVGVKIGSGGTQNLSNADLVIDSFENLNEEELVSNYNTWLRTSGRTKEAY